MSTMSTSTTTNDLISYQSSDYPTTGSLNGTDFFRDLKTGYIKDFIEEDLYGVPVEKLQELIKEHLPEYTL